MDNAMSDADDRGDAIGADPLHDLKNHLTVVKGVAQLLDRQVRRDDWQREKIIARVDRLQDEIARLEQLVEGYESEHAGNGPGRRDDLIH